MKLPLLLICLTLPALGAARELGTYQLILDKQLLGEVRRAPEVIETPQLPQPTEPGWAREYRMTMITEDEDKLRVGLQHVSRPTAVLLIEGRETHPEFALLQGNYSAGTARITYRGVPHEFRLEQSAPPTPQAGPSEPASRTPRSRRGPPRRPQPTTSTDSEPDRPAGIRIRDNEESPEFPTPRRRRFESPEELEAHLQQQQMRAIRQGQPPLPIPLTVEMDDQLVREGVLPPRE